MSNRIGLFVFFLCFFCSFSSFAGEKNSLENQISLEKMVVQSGENKGEILIGEEIVQYSGEGKVSFLGTVTHSTKHITNIYLKIGEETIKGHLYFSTLHPKTLEVSLQQCQFVFQNIPLEEEWSMEITVLLKDGSHFSKSFEYEDDDGGVDALMEQEEVENKTNGSTNSSIKAGEISTGKSFQKVFILFLQGILLFFIFLGAIGIFYQLLVTVVGYYQKIQEKKKIPEENSKV